MGKRLFLLLISSLITLGLSPAVLSATDQVEISGISNDNIVETVEVSEPEPEPEPVVAKAPVAGTAVSSAPVNYTVSYYVGSEEEYVNTAYNLSYSGLYKFEKLVYGHNTANLLGNLSGRYAGETITITEGGVAYSYQVATTALYAKTADGNLNGDEELMADIAYSALGHDIAIMTCAGTSYGNGDASHRLVVFADRL